MSGRARGSSRPRRATTTVHPSNNDTPDGVTNVPPGLNEQHTGPAPAEPTEPDPAPNAGAASAANMGEGGGNNPP